MRLAAWPAPKIILVSSKTKLENVACSVVSSCRACTEIFNATVPAGFKIIFNVHGGWDVSMSICEVTCELLIWETSVPQFTPHINWVDGDPGEYMILMQQTVKQSYWEHKIGGATGRLRLNYTSVGIYQTEGLSSGAEHEHLPGLYNSVGGRPRRVSSTVYRVGLCFHH